MENKQLVEYKEGFISKVRKFLQEIDGNKEALNKLSIDRGKYFSKHIPYILYGFIQMKENDFKSILKLMNKFYLFIKEVNSTVNNLNIIFNIIYYLIYNNHFKIAGVIIYILNKLYKFKFVKNIVRKLTT